MALCRIPELSLFVFNLPNCELLRQITLMEHLPRPLEPDDLDQRFLMKDNTMIFMFHDSEFFSDLLNQDSNNHDLLNQQGMDCSSITDENLYVKFMSCFFSFQLKELLALIKNVMENCYLLISKSLSKMSKVVRSSSRLTKLLTAMRIILRKCPL